jgi:hypothetical protein
MNYSILCKESVDLSRHYSLRSVEFWIESNTNPWDLATAFSQPPSEKARDTIKGRQ